MDRYFNVKRCNNKTQPYTVKQPNTICIRLFVNQFAILYHSQTKVTITIVFQQSHTLESNNNNRAFPSEPQTQFAHRR